MTLKAYLYPNPTIDAVMLNLDNDTRGRVKVDIVDMRGAIVYQNSFEKNSPDFQVPLDVHTLRTGTYIVRITTDKEVGVKKMMKLER